jgi:hypothetical protein
MTRQTFTDVSDNPGVAAEAQRMQELRNGLPLEAFRAISEPRNCPQCGRAANYVSHDLNIDRRAEGVVYEMQCHYRCVCTFHAKGYHDFYENYEYTPPVTGGKLKRV